MVEMNRIVKLVENFQSVNSDGGKEITKNEKSQLASIWKSGNFEGTALTESESQFIAEMLGYENTSCEDSFSIKEPSVRTKRFQHEDGSYHFEIFEEGKPRSYVKYNQNDKKISRTETVMINGVEYDKVRYAYDSNGDVTQVTIFEYDRSGNLQNEKVKDITKSVSSSINNNNGSVKTEQKTPTTALTSREIKEARDSGAVVAARLIGVTSSIEQEVVRLRMEKNNSKNILEFLRGYQSNSKYGDAFFEQLRTEWMFSDKHNLIRQTATQLMDYIIEKEGKDSPIAKEIEVILLEDEFSKKNAQALDKIVKQYLEKYMN